MSAVENAITAVAYGIYIVDFFNGEICAYIIIEGAGDIGNYEVDFGGVFRERVGEGKSVVCLGGF